MKYSKYFLALIIVIGLCQMCLSRRGGGYSGGYRGGSSYRSSSRSSLSSRYYRTPSRYSKSTGYRSSSAVRTRTSSTNRVRRWTTTSKSRALRVGFIFISHRMRARFGSRTYYDDHDVTICRNVKKYPTYNGSTASEVGWFLCPLENEHDIYCCGATETTQHCCSGQSSSGGMAPGTIAALVIVGIIVIIVLGFFIKGMCS